MVAGGIREAGFRSRLRQAQERLGQDNAIHRRVGAAHRRVPGGPLRVPGSRCQYQEKDDPDHHGDRPLGGADFHGDEWSLGRQHHAEDDQDQNAAHVDEELRGADEVRAAQEIDPGGSSERE